MRFKRYEEYNFQGDKDIWYEANVDGVEVSVWKVADLFNKGPWQFGTTFGAVKINNRRRTLKEAKRDVVKLVRSGVSV